ncbi:MAG: ribosome maturation factor RimM [Rhodothermales bacterium]|nr:ribosome maturation factor RimM [Rhodothermales bacterium]
MSATDAHSLRRIGRILRAHGVLGELKVLPSVADIEGLATLPRVWIGGAPDQATAHAVECVRFQHNAKGRLVLLRVAGVVGREAAEAMRGREVFAAAADLPVSDGEAYDRDLLVGLEAFADGAPIGRIHDVLEMPAHHVLVIAREGRPDALVPAVPAFIETIDLAAGRLVIRPIEGLLED